MLHGGAVLAAAQDGGQVKPEAVDPVGGHPVPQAGEDHLLYDRVVAVHGVPAAAEVIVAALRREEVVHIVVKPLEGEDGAVLVALRRVVEDHVQDDLNAVVVEILHQLLQLQPLPVVFHVRCVACVGGEEADSAVAPVVEKLLPVVCPFVHELVELEDGHQLHRIDAQLFQVGDLFPDALEGAGGGDVPGHFCEAPDVELIDHQVLDGGAKLGSHAPVEVIFYDPGPVAVLLDLFAPGALAGDGFGIGVDEDVVPAEEKSLFRGVRAVQPEGVLEFLNVEAEDDHGEDVADPVAVRDGEDRVGILFLPVIEKDLAGRGPL